MINEFIEFIDTSDSDSEDMYSSSSSSSSSESDSEPEEFAAITTFIDTINQMGERQFKENFRLNRSTVLQLIEMYAESDDCPTDDHGGRSKIGAEKEIYAFIWYLATTCTFRELGNLFGLRKSTIWKSVNRVSKWLIKIGHHFVRWPQGNEINTEKLKFPNVPGAIGAIDVSQVTIKRPTNNPRDYFNRKKKYSVALQSVTLANRKFADIFVGEPGSLHDARTLRRSGLYHRCVAHRANVFPNNTFVISDSAYPSLSWLVPVFKDYGNLTYQQKRFNYLLSSSRVVVEHSYGLLKGRFRRILHFTEHRHIGFVVNIITCACILHNICIDQNDEFNEMDIDSDESDSDDESEADDEDNTVLDRRQELFNLMMDRNMLR